jgi:HSP20 family protein
MARGLMRWSPMRDLDRFLDEDMLDAFMGGRDFVPAVDVYQDKDNVVAELSVPGVKPEDVDISIENDVLTVSGHKEEQSETKREDYYRKEIRRGGFSRSVVLPMRVKAEEARAECDNGVLRITMPKAEEAKPKRISVQVGK